MNATQSDEVFPIGEVIADRFRIAKRLSTQTDVTSFEAEHVQTAQRVVVKWAAANAGYDAEEVARRLSVVQRVQHANLAEIYAVGVHRGGHFVVAEWQTGETLAGRIGRARLEPEEVATLFTPAAFAMAEAHAAGVFHGHLSPEHILLCTNADGSVWGPKVIGLGARELARLAASSATQSGRAVELPHYLSPEQLADESVVSAATDVYALGVTLYHALAGVLPFGGATHRDVAAQVLRALPTSLHKLRPDLSVALCGVVARAMSKRAADRFATAREFGEALQRAKPSAPQPARGAMTEAVSPVPPPSARVRAASKPSIPPPVDPRLVRDAAAVSPPPASSSGGRPPGIEHQASAHSTVPPPRRASVASSPASGVESKHASGEAPAVSSPRVPDAGPTQVTAVSAKPVRQSEPVEQGVTDAENLLEEVEERADVFGKRLGRYEILTELAAGGMATVFAARMVGVAGFERIVAVKVLHPHIAHQPEFIEMFLDEARLAARIRHPNVVPTLDISDVSDQGLYLVMEYIEGTHLGELTKAALSKGERLPTRIVAKIVVDALDGLGAAHTLTDDLGAPLGIVHRDVSPPNVMVGTDGIARLTDFGVAKADVRLTTTRTGQVKGKLSYMAPEHASTGVADQRSDLFSMAVVLWESLTGERLFRASNHAATLSKILAAPIPPPSSVAAELKPFDQLLRKALDRDPARRFQTAEEFIIELERVARAHGGMASTREVAKYSRYLVEARLRQQRDRIDKAIAKLGRRDIREHSWTQSGITPLPSGSEELGDPKAPSEADDSDVRRNITKGALVMGGLALLAAAWWVWFGRVEPSEAATTRAEPTTVSAPPAVPAPPATPPAPRVEAANAAALVPSDEGADEAQPLEAPEVFVEADEASGGVAVPASAAAPAESSVPSGAERPSSAGTQPDGRRRRPTLSWMDF